METRQLWQLRWIISVLGRLGRGAEAISRPAWATVWDTISKTYNNNNNKTLHKHGELYHSRTLAGNESLSGRNKWGTPQGAQSREERQAHIVCKSKPANFTTCACIVSSQPYWIASFTLERQLMEPWASHLYWEITRDQYNKENANQIYPLARGPPINFHSQSQAWWLIL